MVSIVFGPVQVTITRMLSSIRYLAIIFLFLVLVGSFMLGFYFRQIKATELEQTMLTQNEAIIATYTDTVWQHFSTPKVQAIPGAKDDFSEQTQKFFHNFNIAKITIRPLEGIKPINYDSQPKAFVTDEDGVMATLFDERNINAGRVVSRVLDHSTITGSPAPKVFMQSIIPIFPLSTTDASRAACMAGTASSCTPEAIANIFNDVTPQWQAMKFQQILFTGLIIATFLILGSGLLISTKRAESIIARQHELNLELTAAAARAEAQSRDKSQFLASVSHELRTPLNAIIGFSEIVKNETKDQLQKIYHDYVEDIYASGKHLLSLINDILDYSKAEAGKLQIEWAETDIRKVIRNSLRMVMPRAETAQITLVEDIPSQHLVITTDAKKLKQVLLNLLSNAVKFTPAGGEVRCQAWENTITKTVMIQVRDTGIGIAPKDISRVMTPFGQVDSALSRKYEGTGLGLPLAKAFLESMGGQFAIESSLNTGTIITITLPKTPKNMPLQNASVTMEDSHVASDPDSVDVA